MANFETQLNNILNDLQKKSENIKKAEKKYVTVCVAEIERTAKTIMRDTITNPNVTYHGNHHPSVAGQPPAVDTGTLRMSVTHTVEENPKGKAVGRVGTDLDYGRYLEFGTTTIKPRPWLSTATYKCESFMKSARSTILGGVIKG